MHLTENALNMSAESHVNFIYMLFYINFKLKFGIKFIGGTVTCENGHGTIFLLCKLPYLMHMHIWTAKVCNNITASILIEYLIYEQEKTEL